MSAEPPNCIVCSISHKRRPRSIPPPAESLSISPISHIAWCGYHSSLSKIALSRRRTPEEPSIFCFFECLDLASLCPRPRVLNCAISARPHGAFMGLEHGKPTDDFPSYLKKPRKAHTLWSYYRSSRTSPPDFNPSRAPPPTPLTPSRPRPGAPGSTPPRRPRAPAAPCGGSSTSSSCPPAQRRPRPCPRRRRRACLPRRGPRSCG
jgi:hypothetical protein